MTFLDLLQEVHVEYLEEGHKHCRPGWAQFDCPHCGKNSQRYHMGYNLAKGYVHCWKCGKHQLAETLAACADIEVMQARKLLRGIERVVSQVKVIQRGQLTVPEGIRDLLPQHRRYLTKRGFDPDAIVQGWGVQGIGIAARLAWRLYIPFHFLGQVVSWTTRSISEDVEQRYLSASADEEALNHKELLYGEDKCKHAACLVEGPTDVWAIGPGGVGTSGTGFSRAQLARFARYPMRGVCFDSEPAAQMRARKIVEELSVFPGETYNIVLEHGKDPASTTKQEVEQVRRCLGL